MGSEQSSDNMIESFSELIKEAEKAKKEGEIDPYKKLESVFKNCAPYHRSVTYRYVQPQKMNLKNLKFTCENLKGNCCICLDPMLCKEEVAVFPCGHTCCVLCTNQLRNNLCPTCRQNYDHCFILNLAALKVKINELLSNSRGNQS